MENGFLALRRIENDMRVAKSFLIVLEVPDRDLALGQEAMTESRISACDTGKLEWHDFAIEGAHNAVQGTHPARRTLRPAHRLRPGQLRDRGRQALRENILRPTPGAVDHSEIKLTLAIGLFGALIERNTRRTQKSLNGFLGCADARTFALFACIRLLRG